MDPITQQQALAAAGAAGGDPVYVDDVFSTYVYEGTGSARTITNGIDISGEGALVWIKSRTSGENHALFDTERGAGKLIQSNSDNYELTSTARLSAFTSSGFTLGTDGATNGSGNDYVSWTFRKAPGFFDVVKYTGTGDTAQSIPHNLGCVPGFIVVKNLDDTGGKPWICYHSGMGNNHYLKLNDDALESQNENMWDQTNPTSTHFTVGRDSDVNKLNHEHIAYIFADGSDAASAVFGTNSDEKIIKCGSYTGTGGADEIDCGFEPQWVLIKKIGNMFDANWVIFDMMRPWVMPTVDSRSLRPNLNSAEDNAGNIHPTSTGFKAVSNDGTFGGEYEYMYVAIRRPFKPPTAGTEVYDAGYAVSGNNLSQKNTTNMPVDLVLYNTNPVGGNSFHLFDRRRGTYRLTTTSLGYESAEPFDFDYQNGFKNSYANTVGHLYYAFKRAAGFFDIVCFTGTGQARTLNHNLGAVPEMMIIKSRSFTNNWAVYHSEVGATKYLRLNNTAAEDTHSNWWNDTAPTSSVFTVGTDAEVNDNGGKLVAWLFASVENVSKVGSYSGTGNNIDVDCGFSSGARFILIKRSDNALSSGTYGSSWFVWDSERGIVSGNDPWIRIDENQGHTDNTDWIDPLNSGFTVTSAAPPEINANGGSYIYFAIA